jgi:hypothetical protein
LNNQIIYKKYKVGENIDIATQMKNTYEEQAKRLQIRQEELKQEIDKVIEDISTSDTFDWL